MSQSSQRVTYDLSRFRVLIVEDYKFISDLMGSALNEMEVGKILTSPDGMEAKQKILDHNAAPSSANIDVVLLDWLMPVMSGQELLEWIRNHKSDTIKFLPVIICSAYTSRDIVEKTRDSGANEVLVKPISAEKMASRIQYVIDRPRPYIKVADFFGPDRRRRDEKITFPDRRTTKAEEIETHVESFE